MSKEIKVLTNSFSDKRIMRKFGEIKKFVIYFESFPESYFLLCKRFWGYFYRYFLKHIYKMNELQTLFKMNKLCTAITKDMKHIYNICYNNGSKRRINAKRFNNVK